MNKLKPIRSFVHRERKLGKMRAEAVSQLWNEYVIESEFNFPAGKTINLEIGFGMGEALFAMAKARPNEFFIGIEVHLPGIAALLTQLQNEPLKNIRIYHNDAIEILEKYIPNNCINKIFLFFPDPWPKRRHHKRRIVQPAFIKLIHNKLKNDGEFYAATDIDDYAQHIIKTTTANGFAVHPKTTSRQLTKFEQRGLREGRKIWNLSFIKKS